MTDPTRNTESTEGAEQDESAGAAQDDAGATQPGRADRDADQQRQTQRQGA